MEESGHEAGGLLSEGACVVHLARITPGTPALNKTCPVAATAAATLFAFATAIESAAAATATTGVFASATSTHRLRTTHSFGVRGPALCATATKPTADRLGTLMMHHSLRAGTVPPSGSALLSLSVLHLDLL